MQQEDFIRAQSAQAQADQGQTQAPQQQNANVQNQYIQDPNFQHQHMQNPNIQTPGFPDQNQNQYVQQNPAAQYPQAQHMQPNPSHTPNPAAQPATILGDFTHDGHTYNIHRLHQLIDARHPNSPAPPNRGAQAFALSSHGAYGPHNAPPAAAPRLGPNGQPMIWMDKFGHTGDWVEMEDPQAYRRDTEENRAERERNMAAQLEFIERNPHRLGPTWDPSWKRW